MTGQGQCTEFGINLHGKYNNLYKCPRSLHPCIKCHKISHISPEHIFWTLPLAMDTATPAGYLNIEMDADYKVNLEN